jgi:hypothetical protein
MTLARIFTLSFLFCLSLHHHVEPVHEFHVSHRRQHAHVAR